MKGYYKISKDTFYAYGGFSNRHLTRKANSKGVYQYYVERNTLNIISK